MQRQITILGAPSSIGIRPYDDGQPRRLDLAPHALRERGLGRRLGAQDAGDVLPPPYRDFLRQPGRVRNEEGIARYSRAIAERVNSALDAGPFLLVLGGDCSIVLGCLLGVRQHARRTASAPRVALLYVDAHGDFATPETSRTGSAASMCLALAVAHGSSPLARLDGSTALVRWQDVVVVGRRDDADAPWYGQDVLRDSPVLDLCHADVRARGSAHTAQAALERLTQAEIAGFWIHVDADVLDPTLMPAVDSPERGGMSLDELAEILGPIAQHPKALGMELTIYDPALDPAGVCADRLVSLLERVLNQGAQR